MTDVPPDRRPLRPPVPAGPPPRPTPRPDARRDAPFRPLLRLRAAALAALLLLSGWGLACRTPTSSGPGAYSWQFLGHAVSGLELVASSPVTSGPWSIVGQPVENPTSEPKPAKLSTTATLSVSYSGSFEDFGGEVDRKDSVRVRVNTTVPPYSAAMLETRRQTQTDFYRFDVRCRWFNTVTGERRSVLYLRDVDGSVRHRWYDDRVSIDRLR